MGYTNTFTAGATAKSSEVNENFTEAARHVNRQDNTTNSAVTNQRIQTGWGFIQGDGTIQLTKAVTFPVAFDAAPIVFITSIGRKVDSDPADITEFVSGIEKATTLLTYNISTTKFNALYRAEVGTTFSATGRYGFSWIAIGTSA